MSEEEAEMAAASAAANGGEICGDSRVFFAFNLHDLNPDAREILDGIARCLTNNAAKKIRVEGHADERGTTQYNLNLGDKRALTAKEYLVRLGVDGSRIGTLSYGEEKPLEPASNEDAWSKNRRVEVRFK
jgi:peptidoglycan-associated lipoprotein